MCHFLPKYIYYFLNVKQSAVLFISHLKVSMLYKNINIKTRTDRSGMKTSEELEWDNGEHVLTNITKPDTHNQQSTITNKSTRLPQLKTDPTTSHGT